MINEIIPSHMRKDLITNIIEKNYTNTTTLLKKQNYIRNWKRSLIIHINSRDLVKYLIKENIKINLDTKDSIT